MQPIFVNTELGLAIYFAAHYGQWLADWTNWTGESSEGLGNETQWLRANSRNGGGHCEGLKRHFDETVAELNTGYFFE